MLPERNDVPNKPPRAPNKITVKEFIRSGNEDRLVQALYDWRKEQTLSLYGPWIVDDFGPDIFMHFSFIDRIVGLAHEHRLKSPKDIIEQVRWNQAGKYAPLILDLIRRHCPEPLPPSPFVTTPMPLRQGTGNDATRPRAAPRCSRCGELGHKRTVYLLYLHIHTLIVLFLSRE